MDSRSRDLEAVSTLAAVSVLIVLAVPGVHLVRAIFALLLVVVLPGYALTAALFGGRQIDWPRRLLLTLGLGLSIAIVVALVLNLTPFKLRSWTWAVALLIVICSGCVVAAERRRDAPAASRLTSFSIPRIRVRDVSVLLAACFVFVGVIAFARTPLGAENALGYSAVWLRPGSHGQTSTVHVGVTSAEKQPTSYRLVLRIGKSIVYDRRLSDLPPGGSFSTRVRLPGGRKRGTRLEALLYLRSRPDAVYRFARLSLRPPSAR
jgi:uncharacterized membrane protein